MTRVRFLALPIGLLAIWAIVCRVGIVDPLFLPAPLTVGRALVSGVFQGELVRDVGATVGRALTGFIVSAIVGVPLGLVVGRNPLLASITQPTVDFFRSIPATALFPLFLFVFGLGDAAKIASVVYACSLIILVNTAYAAFQVKAPRLLAARVMGVTSRRAFWTIVVPESAPGMFAGLRIALSLAFVLVVVTEMFIGTTVGLGYQIIRAQMIYRIPEMYAGIFLAGFVGYFGNRVLLAIERHLIHWVGR